MPAISAIALNQDYAGTVGLVKTLNPIGVYTGIPKWSTSSFPELERITMTAERKRPGAGSSLQTAAIRVTIPTLKQINSANSGAYIPQPALDYVTVVELKFWVDPRATAAEREAALATFLNPSGAVRAAATSFVNGEDFY